MMKPEFEMEKELIGLKTKLEDLRHANAMEELEYKRSTNKIRHANDMERMRINFAEQRKIREDRYWRNKNSNYRGGKNNGKD